MNWTCLFGHTPTIVHVEERELVSRWHSVGGLSWEDVGCAFQEQIAQMPEELQWRRYYEQETMKCSVCGSSWTENGPVLE
jgi:hypothetical protein